MAKKADTKKAAEEQVQDTKNQVEDSTVQKVEVLVELDTKEGVSGEQDPHEKEEDPEEQEPKIEEEAPADQDTTQPQFQQKKYSGCEPVLYYINTTEDEVMVRSSPSMLDSGNVVDIIKEPAGEKEDYPISREYNGWGKIQDEEEWIYLKYTRRAAV